MKAPTTAEVLFSLKTFAAAMLALFLAESIGLQRPFWALTTAYIVSNPLAGAVRSKAVYRIIGTLIGSGAAVFLVPQLVNAPELLSLALALWVGFCLFVSLLDRTPRAYMFMLSGYTAALIGFPVVANPTAIFDVALARVEEITLGIICATLVHSLVFPRSLGPVLLMRLDGAIQDSRQWLSDTLSNTAPEAYEGDRRKLASDITELRLMATHLPFDISNLRWTSRAIHALQDCLSATVPLLSAVEDRLQTLRHTEGEGLSQRWHEVMGDIINWAQSGEGKTPKDMTSLYQEIAELAPPIHRDASWSELVKVNLASRLGALVETWGACLRLRRHIGIGLSDDNHVISQQFSGEKPYVLHRDYRLALMSAFAAVVAITACCAFWILTGWPAGGSAATMAAVLSCLYATQDDPVVGIKPFMIYIALSVPISAVYILGALPAVHNFESLVLVMAPFLLLLGIFLARPATASRAMPLLFGVAGALGLQGSGRADLISFTNNILAQLSGIAIAALFMRLLRTVDAEWTARRLLHAGWRELASLHTVEQVPTIGRMSARMLDRVGLLTPRLAMPGLSEDLDAVDALVDLRAGLNMGQLLLVQSQLAGEGVYLQPLFEDLSTHFRERPQHHGTPDLPLLERIDASLRAVCMAPASKAQSEAVTALVGIRRDLFPDAMAYQAQYEPIQQPGEGSA